MTDLKPLSIEELAAWCGDGHRTIRRLVREGQLPGTVDRYGKYRCTPKDALTWRSGQWEPRPHAEPVTMIRRREAKAS